MGLVGAAGPSAMAKLKGAMAKLSATPGDPKTDILVVIASRLIMNDGNGITREHPTLFPTKFSRHARPTSLTSPYHSRGRDRRHAGPPPRTSGSPRRSRARRSPRTWSRPRSRRLSSTSR
ncbi:hypothetical protein N9M16_00615 [Candidatus Dependentiae bacterium]|nr:hypothetical protein [Candidatus Dependentiae bacterium]